MATKAFPVELSKFEGLGSVTMCGCGVVSLHLAGVTLRLQAAAFSQLEEMIGSAAQVLHTRQAALNSMNAAGSASTTIQQKVRYRS